MESDRDLVLALRACKPDAFERLYAQTSERVWRFLVRLAGAAAEDLFQETWLAAARHVHRLREDTVLLAWLFTIARNKHRNGVRAWARQWRCGQQMGAQDSARRIPLDEEVHLHREVERTQLAFDRLAAAHREVLLLCVVEGLETGAVAHALGCTEEVVRKRLSRARRELARLSGRKELAGDEP